MEAGAGRIHLVVESLAVDNWPLRVGVRLKLSRSPIGLAHGPPGSAAADVHPGRLAELDERHMVLPASSAAGSPLSRPVCCGGDHDFWRVGVSAVATACRVSSTTR